MRQSCAVSGFTRFAKRADRTIKSLVAENAVETIADANIPPANEVGTAYYSNVSAGAAWQCQAGQAAYAASKAGLFGLALPVARDVAGHGVRVVTMAAGLPQDIRARLEQLALLSESARQPDEFGELAWLIVTNRYPNATTMSIDVGLRMG